MVVDPNPVVVVDVEPNDGAFEVVVPNPKLEFWVPVAAVPEVWAPNIGAAVFVEP